MVSRDELREGRTVYDRNGVRLGKIIALGEGAFHIEKGLLFPKDYLARFEDIHELRGGDTYLLRAKEELLTGAESWGEQPAFTGEVRAHMGSGPEEARRHTGGDTEPEPGPARLGLPAEDNPHPRG